MTNNHHSHSHHPQNGNPAHGHPSASAMHGDQGGLKAKPSHEEVARKAFEIYQAENCPRGRDMQHWLQAEAQMSVCEQ